MRQFKRRPGSNVAGHTQMKIEARDLSSEECDLLKRIICCNRFNDPDYQASHPKEGQSPRPFLQGFDPPFEGNDGWALVEFWCRDEKVVDTYIEYINARFRATN